MQKPGCSGRQNILVFAGHCVYDMFEDLKIIHWPDPRLLKKSVAVESYDEDLSALARRMLELMREAKGVGLAAPQVGLNIRLFVMNPTGNPEDDRIVVNPVLDEPNGEEEGEEGCLSLPGISSPILRSKQITLAAFDITGKPIELRESGYVARIWQHEFDHLNGTLLLDRMGPVGRLTHRRAVKELESQYQAANPPPAETKKPARKRG